MTDLDVSIDDFYDDRALLHRVVRSIQLDRGLDYITALDRLHEATDSARANRNPTLRGVLQWAGDEDYLAETLVLLDRRDAAVDAAWERASSPLVRAKTGVRDMVLLDQGDAPDAPEPVDVALALTDPVERERRYQRARRLDARYIDYDNPERGRHRFFEDDRLHLEAGEDLVRTLERPAAVSEANRNAAAIAMQLDAAMAADVDKRQRLKLLDEQISKLEGPGADAVQARARDELAREHSGSQTLRMLDQLEGTLSAEDPVTGRDLYAATQERLRLLDRPQEAFLTTMQEVIEGAPLPASRELEAPGAADVDRHRLAVAREFFDL
jgi:hypothetical protein